MGFRQWLVTSGYQIITRTNVGLSSKVFSGVGKLHLENYHRASLFKDLGQYRKGMFEIHSDGNSYSIL